MEIVVWTQILPPLGKYEDFWLWLGVPTLLTAELAGLPACADTGWKPAAAAVAWDSCLLLLPARVFWNRTKDKQTRIPMCSSASPGTDLSNHTSYSTTSLILCHCSKGSLSEQLDRLAGAHFQKCCQSGGRLNTYFGLSTHAFLVSLTFTGATFIHSAKKQKAGPDGCLTPCGSSFPAWTSFRPPGASPVIN